MSEMQKGILAMIGACTVWGLSPLFYKLLSHVPPLEVLAHRTLWSFVLFAVILALRGRLGDLRAALGDGRRVALFALASAMISINWFFYILSVQIGHTTEASLGYYIFPLVAVLVGRFGFGERLARAQWLAVGLAALAVMGLTWGLGVAPWISLLLATTFGLYGAVKKYLPVGPMVSVTIEILFFLPIGITMLVIQHGSGQGAFGRELWDSALLILSGPLTALPLILFSFAARRVPMATVGVLQYLNPTLQFLCAVLVFGEPFTFWHQIAFGMIWCALALFSVSSLRQDRASRRASMAATGVSTHVRYSASEASAKP
ncbi:EamA family transporter RarD [Antarcticimicrobium sediminis]|uniref:EamA family transporter RarD n=1 Tax=Antarcticimicrobium sediminis TaxID=2546227 RepID=A0A4R5F055_9RHOB|nr:EamA family transporter RarD [Antarcticimicrobium sediminis]TDE40828.1 EamA family transporter RarD [Antarcticimicrobium sediminis]